MTIQELYAKRASAWEAAKQFLDTHRMENGTLSAEDGAVYDRMEGLSGGAGYLRNHRS